jgi:DNA repair protein RecO (recombination protein O)|tara:strand:- start:729 stop:1409 length:681 start_codon:yes stop_codon:yes gene_type:complete
MNWEDEGFLLSKRKFRENANIVEVFTSKFGKMSGIVYGGNSRKIRNFLQISNKIFIFYNSKNSNKIGYFKAELLQPIAPNYFNDKKRTSALLSYTGILNSLLPDSQPQKKVYNSLVELIKNFDNDKWFLLYIYWELSLIKELGFDPSLKRFKKKQVENFDVQDVDIDGIKYQVPNFLINEQLPNSMSNKLIRKSLVFTRNMMTNKFFLPNNLVFPKSRIILENYFN